MQLLQALSLEVPWKQQRVLPRPSPLQLEHCERPEGLQQQGLVPAFSSLSEPPPQSQSSAALAQEHPPQNRPPRQQESCQQCLGPLRLKPRLRGG